MTWPLHLLWKGSCFPTPLHTRYFYFLKKSCISKLKDNSSSTISVGKNFFIHEIHHTIQFYTSGAPCNLHVFFKCIIFLKMFNLFTLKHSIYFILNNYHLNLGVTTVLAWYARRTRKASWRIYFESLGLIWWTGKICVYSKRFVGLSSRGVNNHCTVLRFFQLNSNCIVTYGSINCTTVNRDFSCERDHAFLNSFGWLFFMWT